MDRKGQFNYVVNRLKSIVTFHKWRKYRSSLPLNLVSLQWCIIRKLVLCDRYSQAVVNTNGILDKDKEHYFFPTPLDYLCKILRTFPVLLHPMMMSLKLSDDFKMTSKPIQQCRACQNVWSDYFRWVDGIWPLCRMCAKRGRIYSFRKPKRHFLVRPKAHGQVVCQCLTCDTVIYQRFFFALDEQDDDEMKSHKCERK